MTLPEPNETPPLEAAPGCTSRMLAPMLAIVCCSASFEPCPISIMAMTAATPIRMPSVVRADRVLLRVSAFKATVRVRGKRWPTEERGTGCEG